MSLEGAERMALAAADEAYVMRVDGHFGGTMQKLSAIWRQQARGRGGAAAPVVLLVFLRHYA